MRRSALTTHKKKLDETLLDVEVPKIAPTTFEN